jgi:septal ring factor EnvC (AmiA/AmiB activator)
MPRRARRSQTAVGSSTIRKLKLFASRSLSSLKCILSQSQTKKCDKAKKTLENDFHDLEEKFNELQNVFNRTLAERKKFEADAIAASDELQEVKFELKNSDDKVSKGFNLILAYFRISLQNKILFVLNRLECSIPH